MFKLLQRLAPTNTQERHSEKIAELSYVCRRVCDGDFEARVLNVPDQPGPERELILNVNEMIDRMDAYVRDSKACLHYVAENRYFRRIVERGMNGSYLAAAQTINHAASVVEQKMEAFGNDTLAKVQSVASAAEELTASIQEISRQVTQSAEVSSEAVGESKATGSLVEGLADKAREIDGAIRLIDKIAEQTNLLALNATIEASRAGDAGKGFSVVASEVKTLARETAKATDEIESHLAEIQRATLQSAESVTSVCNTVEKIDSITNSIAAAVEEQGVATSEIARSIDDVKCGVIDITSSNSN